jgi:hypothetical protein
MQFARRITNAWNRWYKRTDPLEEERQSAFGVWRYGYEYIKASKTIDDHDPNPWVASSVTYQCLTPTGKQLLGVSPRSPYFEPSASNSAQESRSR